MMTSRPVAIEDTKQPIKVGTSYYPHASHAHMMITQLADQEWPPIGHKPHSHNFVSIVRLDLFPLLLEDPCHEHTRIPTDK
jgi:hypothetical protein